MIKSWNGSSWTPPAGMSPALLCAIEYIRVNTRPTGKLLHDAWILDYNFSAGEFVRVRDADQPWNERPANIVHLYPPGCPYWETPRPGEVNFISHCAYISFADTGILGLERLLHPRLRYARFVDEDCLVGDLLSRMAKTSGNTHGYWQAHALFYQLISLLFRADHVEGETYRILDVERPAAASGFVGAVRTYLHEHLTESITLADIAWHLQVSPSSLSHRYRAEAGEAPMAALKRLRIELAKVLLAKGYQLKEVARQVGFCDEFYLSKAFKQLEGVSPRAYRDRLLNVQADATGNADDL